MKRLFYFTCVVVLTAIFISSCGSSMSITKRRYNKGYFVERYHKHRSESHAKAERKNLKAQPLQALKIAEESRKARLAKQESVKNIPQEKQTIAASIPQETKQPVVNHEKIKLTRQQKKALVKMVMRDPAKTVRALPEQLGTAAAADNDLISLVAHARINDLSCGSSRPQTALSVNC